MQRERERDKHRERERNKETERQTDRELWSERAGRSNIHTNGHCC